MAKTEAFQTLGDLMPKADDEDKGKHQKLPRCHNEAADCSHLIGAHLKGGGRCCAKIQIDARSWKACKCKKAYP